MHEVGRVPVTTQSDNQTIAERLREMAELIEAQGANPFRVGAYRKAGDSIAGLGEDVRDLFEEQGSAGLEAIPGVGKGIASAIVEMLTTGRWIQLQRLRGTVDPHDRWNKWWYCLPPAHAQ